MYRTRLFVALCALLGLIGGYFKTGELVSWETAIYTALGFLIGKMFILGSPEIVSRIAYWNEPIQGFISWKIVRMSLGWQFAFLIPLGFVMSMSFTWVPLVQLFAAFVISLPAIMVGILDRRSLDKKVINALLGEIPISILILFIAGFMLAMSIGTITLAFLIGCLLHWYLIWTFNESTFVAPVPPSSQAEG